MTTKLDEEILFCTSLQKVWYSWHLSATRNILVVLVFHYIILTCALASVFEVLRFIILLIIQLIFDEATSRSLHWFFFFAWTSKTENFWLLFCFSYSSITQLNITEKDKIAHIFKLNEKWGGKLNVMES